MIENCEKFFVRRKHGRKITVLKSNHYQSLSISAGVSTQQENLEKSGSFEEKSEKTGN